MQAIELAPTSLVSGLVAHWTFDETEGTVAYDHSGNQRDATLTGAQRIDDGKFGRALHFASGDFAVAAPFPDATPSWSVSAWVRVNAADISGSYVTIVSTETLYAGGWELNATPGPGFHFGYWIGPGRYEYTDMPCPCLPSGVWTHAAIVLDGATSTLTFYRDAVEQRSLSNARPISPGESSLYMGKWMGGTDRLLVGSLDDISIYNRPLRAEEIAALSAHPAPDPH